MSVAALNARGMNLIVFINLIMACVLAIRVALKTLQVALIIAETVFAVCAAIPAFVGNVLEPVGARYVRRGNCLEEPLDHIWAESPARSAIINNKRWLSVLG